MIENGYVLAVSSTTTGSSCCVALRRICRFYLNWMGDFCAAQINWCMSRGHSNTHSHMLLLKHSFAFTLEYTFRNESRGWPAAITVRCSIGAALMVRITGAQNAQPDVKNQRAQRSTNTKCLFGCSENRLAKTWTYKTGDRQWLSTVVRQCSGMMCNAAHKGDAWLPGSIVLALSSVSAAVSVVVIVVEGPAFGNLSV